MVEVLKRAVGRKCLHMRLLFEEGPEDLPPPTAWRWQHALHRSRRKDLARDAQTLSDRSVVGSSQAANSRVAGIGLRFGDRALGK